MANTLGQPLNLTRKQDFESRYPGQVDITDPNYYTQPNFDFQTVQELGLESTPRITPTEIAPVRLGAIPFVKTNTTEPILNSKGSNNVNLTIKTPAEEMKTLVDGDTKTNDGITYGRKSTPATVSKSWLERLNETTKNSRIASVASLGMDAANFITELFRGTSQPFVSPNVNTFTPTQSVRNEQIQLGKEQIQGNTDAIKNLMTQYGAVTGAPGLLADENKAMNELYDKVAITELQRQIADNARFDEVRNKQSAIDAETANKNIMKQMQENQTSGQIMGLLQDRMFNSLSDIQHNKYNEIINNELFSDSTSNKDYVQALMDSVAGRTTSKKRTNRDNQN